eukprot:UN22232
MKLGLLLLLLLPIVYSQSGRRELLGGFKLWLQVFDPVECECYLAADRDETATVVCSDGTIHSRTKIAPVQNLNLTLEHAQLIGLTNGMFKSHQLVQETQLAPTPMMGQIPQLQLFSVWTVMEKHWRTVSV